MYKIVLIAALLVVNGGAFAKSGGVDKNGCHTPSEGKRECFGENKGKYIPEAEEKRMIRQHKEACSGVDGEGRKIRFDAYGKPCRNRK